VVSNKGIAGNYAAKSNAVSVPIGAPISVLSVTQAGCMIKVNGTGFSKLTVINFFNLQGAVVVNLGGLVVCNVDFNSRIMYNSPHGQWVGVECGGARRIGRLGAVAETSGGAG
jgi:hypothetical protein